MTNASCNVQYTQFASKDDIIELASGSCRAPYRCSQCKYRVNQTLADPEKKGRAYVTNGCERPNKLAHVKAHQWMQDEADRIRDLHGRVAEVQLEDLTKKERQERAGGDGTPRYAVFVNDVRRDLSRALKVVDD